MSVTLTKLTTLTIRQRAQQYFPNSRRMQCRWMRAKYFLGCAKPKVVIGCKYEARL